MIITYGCTIFLSGLNQAISINRALAACDEKTGREIMAIHSFYVIAWDSGQPIYHRTWIEVSDNPTLLSGLLASVELLALKITRQHVNVVTLRDSRFFFKIDEDNGLLFVIITDIVEDPTRFYEYLDMLNQRFVETFDDHQTNAPIYQFDPRRSKVFDELVDSLVSHWETGEVTLKAAKVMDILDVFTQFYNIILQKVLSSRTREMYISDVQRIFQTHTSADPALSRIQVDAHGVVSFDQVIPENVRLGQLQGFLNIILQELVAIARRSRRRQTYETLFFEHLAPIIKAEQSRIKEYDLTNQLVMELL